MTDHDYIGSITPPVTAGWFLMSDDAHMTDEQAEVICDNTNLCSGGGAYDIYRALLIAPPAYPIDSPAIDPISTRGENS